MRFVLTAAWMTLACVAACATPAFAQSEPLPLVAVDLRLALPSLGQSATTAAGLGVAELDLPGRARGGVAAVHVYPLRRAGWALGIGAEAIAARGSAQKKDVAGKAIGPLVRQRFGGVTGQLSLNFGRRSGWSYLTAGAGSMKFDTYLDGNTPNGARPMTINFGGGARWFKYTHVAFAVDLRFYLTQAADATPTTAPREAKRVVIISVGVGLK